MSMDQDVMDDPFDSYVEHERESETADSVNEAEMLGEEERTKEELWYDIYQAVRNARRYLISEKEIQRAVTEAIHD